MDRSGSTITTLADSLANSPIAGVLRRAEVLEKVETVLLPLFPGPVAANVRICNYEEGVLVLLVASPVWKAKLRMIKPDLIRRADQAGIVVRDIEVRSVPSLPVTRDRAQLEITASPTAREALAEALRLLESGD